MPPSFYCQVCGALAFPYNSNLVDGQRFVHRGCKDRVLEADPEWDEDAEVPAK